MLKIHVAPKRAPRLAPGAHSDGGMVMLAAVLFGLVMAFVAGVIVWALMR